MDPNNPVVKLVTAGMTAESEGRFEDARQQFQAAWDARNCDYDACIAAHYLARQQPSEADALKWHQAALEYADKVNDDRTRGFRASLHLSIGQSAEKCGDLDLARSCVLAADQVFDDVLEGAYKDHLKSGYEELKTRLS